jgi:uncharacterized protein (DUF2236 family)
VLLGGPTALLLQVAHPLVAEGVAVHSDYRAGPAPRLLATLQAVLAVSFGDTEQARAAARAVGRRHAPVRGATRAAVPGVPAGTAYRASDPHQALWVHATLVRTALDVVERLGVRPVDAGLRERYWQQSKPVGRLFGVTDAVWPVTGADFDDYWRTQRKVDACWNDPKAWRRSSILNTARVGWFSSDRTIREYADDIWNVPVGPGKRNGGNGG